MCSVLKRIFNMNRMAGYHRSNGGNSERRAEPVQSISDRVPGEVRAVPVMKNHGLNNSIV
jgi:hypothetical protein